MIMYDFKCHDCGATYEKLMRSDSTPKCKECESTKNQERLISGCALAYATDDNSPKTERDLQHYFGNGEYVKGYKRGS